MGSVGTLYRVVRSATRTLSGWVSDETDDRAQAVEWQTTYGGRIQQLTNHYWADDRTDTRHHGHARDRKG